MVAAVMGIGWWLALAVVVLVIGVGRVARLVTYDKFPPAAALREWWTRVTAKRKGDWGLLLWCQWCFTPWLMLVAGGWFLLTFSHPFWAWSWWLFWGWMALSYLASMVVARDEPAGE